MAIERWRSGSNNDDNVPARPDNPFNRLQREMNRLFETFLEGSPVQQRNTSQTSQGEVATRQGQFTPRLDISEDASQLKVAAELPGMSQDDIGVTASDDSMTIEGEKTYESEEENENFHRTERSYGYFKRTIPMPSNVDVDGAEATFKEGVLNVRVPKTGESEDRKTLQISTD